MAVLVIQRGASFRAQLAFDDGEATPSPVDLTGSTVTVVITWRAGQLPVPFAVTNAAGGLGDIAITDEGTSLLPLGKLSRMTITREIAGGDTEVQAVDIEVV